MVVVFPAVLIPGDAGVLHARFVDLPELEVSASTAAELIRLARERLTAELQRREAQDEPWPEPTPVEGVVVPAGGSLVLVDASVDDAPVRLTISLGERLLKRIDDDAAARSMTRSGYLALGARGLLGERTAPFGGADADMGRRIQEEVAALGRRVNETLGPNSPVGRTLAEIDAIALEGLRRLTAEVRSAMGPKPERPHPRTDPPNADPSPSAPD